jgi:hypothetical protein
MVDSARIISERAESSAMFDLADSGNGISPIIWLRTKVPINTQPTCADTDIVLRSSKANLQIRAGITHQISYLYCTKKYFVYQDSFASCNRNGQVRDIYRDARRLTRSHAGSVMPNGKMNDKHKPRYVTI